MYPDLSIILQSTLKTHNIEQNICEINTFLNKLKIYANKCNFREKYFYKNVLILINIMFIIINIMSSKKEFYIFMFHSSHLKYFTIISIINMFIYYCQNISESILCENYYLHKLSTVWSKMILIHMTKFVLSHRQYMCLRLYFAFVFMLTLWFTIFHF